MITISTNMISINIFTSTSIILDNMNILIISIILITTFTTFTIINHHQSS